MIARARAWLQPRLNEAVVYCRLCDMGFSRATAMRMAGIIGRFLNPVLYGKI